jgi:hypothetical protein
MTWVSAAATVQVVSPVCLLDICKPQAILSLHHCHEEAMIWCMA